ncbi:threonine aldolase family protein [Ancylobacter amanitiformis]|uniref:Threonine aldolase n=1 Tax=Ancylobacter amanitiformis TaxID=217069 RepID=A0ABU0LWA5_9HYPH|nr:threonine aldolase family protein [Ancylobacter amanitiformis]MDQ0512880.1 threonine aldolase [Ancylobacter amanitiformis]
MMYTPQPAAGHATATVKLYSDTLTLPSPAMKRAMFEAELGDEQAGLDPTVNALCARVAALLGKPSAMFLPSGTMCNQIAMLVHARPGDAILAHKDSHIIAHEAGAAAALGGGLVTGLAGEAGQFGPDDIRAALRAASRYAPEPRLLVVEQTAHLGGGSVWALDRLRAAADEARGHGMATYMDGARLMNAVVASGVGARDMASQVDSVSLCFSKGLGAPFGAVLAGSPDFIDRAWRWKQRLGGAMRQVGMYAAACLFALDHNVDRLAEDHRHATRLAEGLSSLPGLRITPPQTNIVLFDTLATGITSFELRDRLAMHGVSITAMDRYLGRAVTHLHVDTDAIERAIAAFQDVLVA